MISFVITPIEVIVIVLSILIVGSVIIMTILNKKKGKHGCCDCSSCPYHQNCKKNSK